MNISNRLISTAARQRAAALLKELSLEEKSASWAAPCWSVRTPT